MTEKSHNKSSDLPEWVPLSEAAKYSPYSAEYLSLLARKQRIVAKKINGTWHTTRTVLEDYLRQQADRAQVLNRNPDTYRPFISNELKANDTDVQKAVTTPTEANPVKILPVTKLSPSYNRSYAEDFAVAKKKHVATQPAFKTEVAQLAHTHREHAVEKKKTIPVTVPARSQPTSPLAKNRTAPASSTNSIQARAVTVAEPAQAVTGKINDPLFEEFMRRFNAHIDRQVAERQSVFSKMSHFVRSSFWTIFTSPKLLAVFLILLVISVVLPFRYVSGFADGFFQNAVDAVRDAQTVMGFRPGTHENEILLLGQHGEISIFGDVETEGQFRSFVANGIAPITVTSTTKVENLNADYFDDLSSQEFTLAFVTKNGNVTYEPVRLEGTVEVGSTLLVRGATNLLNHLRVDGGLSVLGDASFGGSIHVSGPATFKDILRAPEVIAEHMLRAEDGLYVGGESTFADDVELRSDLDAQDAEFGGRVTVEETFLARGDVQLGGDDRVVSIHTDEWSISENGASDFESLSVGEDASIGGTLSVADAAEFLSAVTAESISVTQFITNGTSTFSGALALQSAVLDVTGNAGASNMILQSTGTSTRWIATSTLGFFTTADIDTEAKLEAMLTDVTDVFTNNDGALADDDLSNNTTDELTEGATNFYWTNSRFDTRLSATTSLPNLTTLAGLTTVGTITSGIWNAGAVTSSGLITGTAFTGTDAAATSTFGHINTNGDAYIGGNLTVAGDSFVFGTSSASTLTINSTINSSLVPQMNATFDLGSAAFFWDDAFVDSMTVNNLSAASTTISGTQAESFTLNSDNVTTDTENIDLIFYRGTVVPNALITWDATLDRFDINQPFFIQNDSSTTTVATLDVRGSSNQTADIFRVASSSGSTLFNITPQGTITTGIWNGTDIDISDYTNLAVSATGLALTGDTLALSPGYVIPFIASTTEWATAYGWGNHATENYFDKDIDDTDDLTEGSTNLFSQWSNNGSDIYYNTGNVGIGTTTPSTLFAVHTASSPFTGTVNSNLLATFAKTSSSGAIADIAIVGGSAGMAEIFLGGDGTSSYNNGRIVYDASTNAMGLWTSDTEKLSITSAGNVGIGTTSPAVKLQVAGGTDSGLASGGFIISGETGGANISIDNNEIMARSNGTAASLFLNHEGGTVTVLGGTPGTFSVNTDALYVNSSGNVGVGTSSPTRKFEVNEPVATFGMRIQTGGGYIDFGPANTLYAHIYTDRPNFYFNAPLLRSGNLVWDAGNDGSGSGLDADTLDSLDLTSASTGNTVVQRDSSGDIHARLLRSEYDTTNSSIGYIMTQVDTASNNYVRPSTPAQLVTALGLEAGGSRDIWVEKAGDTMTGTLTVNSTANPGISVGNGSTGYLTVGSSGWYDDGSYFSPSGGRHVYIRATTPTTYIYSPNIYLGSASGTDVHLRGNNISGNNFSIPASGAATFTSGITTSGAISGVTTLSFSDGSNHKILSNASGLIFDGGDGTADLLVYDETVYTDQIRMGYQGTALITTYDSGEDLQLSSNAGDVYVNDSLGVGTASPSNALHVAGNIGATGYIGAGCEAACEASGGYSLLYSDGRVVSTTYVQSPYFTDSDNGSYYVDPAGTAVLNSVCAGGNCGSYLSHDGTYMRVNGSGHFRVTGTFYNDGQAYSTMFRDANNSGYYVDPASTSNINALTAAGAVTFTGLATSQPGYYVCYNTSTGGLTYHSNCQATGGFTPYLFVKTVSGDKLASDVLFGYPSTHFESYDEAIAAYDAGEVGEELFVLPISPDPIDGVIEVSIRETEKEISYFDTFELSKVVHPNGTALVTDNELQNLFALPYENIDTLLKPRSIVHENPELLSEGDTATQISFSSPGSGYLYISTAMREVGASKPRLIEYREEGDTEWQELTYLQPRYPNYTPHVIELPEDIVNGFVLRITNYADLRVEQIGVLRDFDPQSVSEVDLPMRSVSYRENPDDQRSRLASKDGEFLRIMTGDEVTLQFDDMPTTDGTVSYLLRAAGFYMNWNTGDRRMAINALNTITLKEQANQILNTFAFGANGSQVGVGTNALHASTSTSTIDSRFFVRGTGNTASTTAFGVFDVAGAPVLFTQDDGTVGIGTTTPQHKLHVIGDVAANSFINTSTRDSKTDIAYLETEWEAHALDVIGGLKLAQYRYRSETASGTASSSVLHLGLIAEEAPREVLSADGKGVDLYKLITLALGGIKAQQRSVADVEATVASLVENVSVLDTRVADLSPNTVAASTTATSTATSTVESENETVLDRLVALAQGFVDGVLSIVGVEVEYVKADHIQTDELCVGDVCVDEPTFLEMVKSAGQVHALERESSEVTDNNLDESLDEGNEQGYATTTPNAPVDEDIEQTATTSESDIEHEADSITTTPSETSEESVESEEEKGVVVVSEAQSETSTDEPTTNSGVQDEPASETTSDSVVSVQTESGG